MPLSIWIVEYQIVGDWPMTRALTGSRAGERGARVEPEQALELAVLAHRLGAGDGGRAQLGVLGRAGSSTSFLASSVSPNQPARSRTGFSARLAPSWIGETTSRTPFWTL